MRVLLVLSCVVIARVCRRHAVTKRQLLRTTTRRSRSPAPPSCRSQVTRRRREIRSRRMTSAARRQHGATRRSHPTRRPWPIEGSLTTDRPSRTPMPLPRATWPPGHVPRVRRSSSGSMALSTRREWCHEPSPTTSAGCRVTSFGTGLVDGFILGVAFSSPWAVVGVLIGEYVMGVHECESEFAHEPEHAS